MEDNRRRASRVSQFQWETILEELAKDPAIFTGYKNTARGREKVSRLWRELAPILNSFGSGATKSPQEWATFQWFNNVKCSHIRSVSTGTGGGPAMEESLTDIELRLLELFGPGFGEGAPGVRVEPFAQNTSSTEENFHLFQTPTTSTNYFEHVPVAPSPPPVNTTPPPSAPSPPPASPPPPAPALPTPSAAGHMHPIVATADSPTAARRLPRRNRARQAYRARPLAPLDEANRLLSNVELQRIAAEREIAHGLMFIGTNLGRIAAALERNLATTGNQD